jgi:Cu-Zn family superoxide dismutase
MNLTNLYKKKYLKYKTKYINLTNSINTPDSNELIKAIAFFNNSDISGSVIFEEIQTSTGLAVHVNINLKGFEPNTVHGFHVHEYGDLSNGCDSLCNHFNPFNETHGAREDIHRHVGDLGNIHSDLNGFVIDSFIDSNIKLRGQTANIIGRGLIIHADPDDCGKGNNEASKINGNAGKRIACAIIGYSSK